MTFRFNYIIHLINIFLKPSIKKMLIKLTSFKSRFSVLHYIVLEQFCKQLLSSKLRQYGSNTVCAISNTIFSFIDSYCLYSKYRFVDIHFAYA